MVEYVSLLDIIDNPQQFNNEDGSFNFKKFYEFLPLETFPEKSIQSLKVPNSKEEGYSSVYRNSKTPNGLVSTVHPEINTSHKLFEKSVELFGDSDLFGIRKFNNEKPNDFDDFYTYQTYKEIAARRTNLSSGIKTILPRDEFVVSVFSPNRPEWMITQLAANSQSLPITALYDTLGANTAEYILNITESPILVCPLDKISSVLTNITNDNKTPNLKFIISMDEIEFDKHFGLIQFAKNQGISIMSMNQLEAIGELNPVPFNEPSPETIFGISFTSGTTGNPKGVVLDHQALAAGVGATLAGINRPPNLKKGEQIQCYSFLPLAHIYELLSANLQVSRGARVAFPNRPSDPTSLVECLKIAKPHLIALVPRVYSKFETALKQGLNSTVKGRFILNTLLSDSTPAWIKSSLQAKTRQIFGFDNLEFAISGSAPLNPDTAEFLKKTLGIKFKQGYGLTESTSGISSSSLLDRDIGSSGGMHMSCDARLKDVPEMGYLTTDSNGNELEEPSGELLLRGPQNFKGYYKNPEATAEVLSNDNWFSTGDVAKFDKYGRVHIVDRVKNFFKLSQGEYISPEKIENIYLSSCPYISQIFVTGLSIERYLVGIVGIDPLIMRKYFKNDFSHKISDSDIIEKINGDNQLKRKIINKMNSKCVQLQGFEKIHNLKAMIEPLKIADETITPTQKIKRKNCNKFFKSEIDQLYAQGDLIRGDKI